ncbi:hypothetical protein [Ferrovibrio xuzhouensis]|uniref:HEPN domain-containing protein n=1 Tax=Ferrovibrio xuzhouensis TaxID=1576914 RepID=A0ABV7VEM3_9PROT
MRAESQVTQSGFLFTTFYSDAPAPDMIGKLPAATAKEKLKIIEGYSDVILELAATMVFLSRNGYPDKYIDETTARKPLKSTTQRVEKAQELLKRLEIEMPQQH